MSPPGSDDTLDSSKPAPPRVVIENVSPCIDAGRFPIKRTRHEAVCVEADIFVDGHDHLAACVRFKPKDTAEWSEAPLTLTVNDRWTGRFIVDTQGTWQYTIVAWVNRFDTWTHALSKKHDAGQDVASELLEGAQFIRDAASHAPEPTKSWLAARSHEIEGPKPAHERVRLALDAQLAQLMYTFDTRVSGTEFSPVLSVQVERERARYGAWYELFPRSTAPRAGNHGTFADLEARLPYIADMGFDVVYLPPIHPIGKSFRKGPNNSLECAPTDPGSPWAIGAAEGGHTAILPALGTIQDFDALVASAAKHHLEIALDIAFQCSPDHPWVREHPAWFRHRPDGTIKYAENPPKKYQDIYPLNFDNEDWFGLWKALRDVFLFWIDHGVNIFRVDNPHTKAFPFWEWCLADIWHRDHDAIFLSEAFTRPKVMKRLAKAGFTQSYTYFTWRNDKAGLTEYFTELTRGECAEYLRPNLFANTPDILHEYLQTGGPAAFKARLVLAATLGATYGIYGPPFELCDGTPVRPGSEEYLNSEKYQIRHWNLDEPVSLRALIKRVNTIRRTHPQLQFTRNLRFFETDNPKLIAYGKADDQNRNLILMVVNLDPHHPQSGHVILPVDDYQLGWTLDGYFTAHDLLDDSRYTWRGARNYVELSPTKAPAPAHLFRME